MYIAGLNITFTAAGELIELYMYIASQIVAIITV